MTHDDILMYLESAFEIVEREGGMTRDMKTALRYVARVIVDEKLAEFHSRIGQKET